MSSWPPVHDESPAPPTRGLYDLVVIGGGSGGLSAALMGAQLGASVLLVEKKGRLGGVGTHQGALPSQALASIARRYHTAITQSRFGLPPTEAPYVDVAGVMKRVRDVRRNLHKSQTPDFLAERGIETLLDSAVTFIDSSNLSVNGLPVRFRRCIIATGASPKIPKGVAATGPLTHETVWRLRDVPEYLVILGAGPAGVEAAQAWRRFGANVTLLTGHTGLVLPNEEPELSDMARYLLQSEGVEVIQGKRSVSANGQSGAGKVQGDVTVTLPNGEMREASHLMVAVGRNPRVDELELENAGVEVDGYTGGIQVNSQLRSTNSKVWAVGDVNGGPQQARVAESQGRMAAENALSSFIGRVLGLTPKIKKWNPDWVGKVIQLSPEFAHVGLTENEARNRWGRGVKVWNIDTGRVRRAVCDDDEMGLMKVVCRGDTIVGAHVVARHAGALIAQFATAVRHGLTLSQLGDVSQLSGTYGEGVGFLVDERHYDGMWSMKSRGKAKKYLKRKGNEPLERMY